MKHHLKDRHEGKWNSFSLYLVRKSDHIKELESLILRIADQVKGRLPNADNMQRRLKGKIKKRQEKNLNAVLNVSRTSVKKKTTSKIAKKPSSKSSGRTPVLAPYAGKRFSLQAIYKKKLFKASVLTDGTIKYNGERFNSPSLAAVAIVGRAMNGGAFWKFKDANNNWVKLDALRK